jgi:hypothetical protein
MDEQAGGGRMSVGAIIFFGIVGAVVVIIDWYLLPNSE